MRKSRTLRQLHKIARNATQFVVKSKCFLQIPENSASFCSLFGKNNFNKKFSISQARMQVAFAQKMKLFEKEAKFSKKS